ncbi:hypothetical protein D3C87_1865580 [compost metagenome]
MFFITIDVERLTFAGREDRDFLLGQVYFQFRIRISFDRFEYLVQKLRAHLYRQNTDIQ